MTAHDDSDELVRLWRDSDRRSRARRAVPRRRHRIRAVVVPAAVVTCALGVDGAAREDDATARPDKALARAISAARYDVKGVVANSPPSTPTAPAVRNAWRFAQRRGGQVSLAVVDTEGRLRGRRAARPYVSASVAKAMLLVAELRRLHRDAVALDSATERLLRAMITYSDNASADSIYGRVGDPGLLEVARAAGMRRFSVAGYWANAQITAADLARFFWRLHELVPRRHRQTALGLLASVVREQRWGVPRAAGERWRVYFKGGWRATGSGELVHQGAWLRNSDRHFAIAVLTDAQPSRLYGIHTVRGIADRLLAPH